MSTNDQTALQLTCTINENDEVTFGSYKIIDSNGNEVGNNDSWIDDLINNDLNSSVLNTLQESLKVAGISSFKNTIFTVNVAMSAVQNHKQAENQYGDSGYKDEIIASINTAVETGISIAYGTIGFAAGAPAGPVGAVAGAASFSFAALKYYENYVEPGFTEFLSTGYDYLFDSNIDQKTITYDSKTSETYNVESGNIFETIADNYNLPSTSELFSIPGNEHYADRIIGNYTLTKPTDTINIGLSLLEDSFTLNSDFNSDEGKKLPDWMKNVLESIGVAESHKSPLVLDLDNDDVELKHLDQGVYFDIDNDGFALSSLMQPKVEKYVSISTCG